MSDPIRILIVDDHPVVRDGLRAMLATQPDFEVIAEAASGQELLAQAAGVRPDLVLLDLEMPEMDGVEALRQLRQRQPGARVLVFTAFDTDERILAAVRAGAQGYLLKGSPRHEIFHAIRVVSRGGSLLQSVVQSRLLSGLAREAQSGDGASLTRRERQVLELLAQGKSNREIAVELGITLRTAKFHMSAILGKLGAGNRTEAVHIARRQGLLD
jgi:DNA-binding NarL/FixJ family response regulator